MLIVDDETKAEVSNVSKIKTNIPARIKKISESVTEPFEFGWMFMSAGQEYYSDL